MKKQDTRPLPFASADESASTIKKRERKRRTRKKNIPGPCLSLQQTRALTLENAFGPAMCTEREGEGDGEREGQSVCRLIGLENIIIGHYYRTRAHYYWTSCMLMLQEKTIDTV